MGVEKLFLLLHALRNSSNKSVQREIPLCASSADLKLSKREPLFGDSNPATTSCKFQKKTSCQIAVRDCALPPLRSRLHQSIIPCFARIGNTGIELTVPMISNVT